ncbi:MAG: AbrB/MazE/SpoVT family DNA-binding domain-containing protein [Promethearchaeota archaeon]
MKVTNKGIISISADIRKKYNISNGYYVIVKEENGVINIIPIEPSISVKSLTYESHSFRGE